MSLSSHLDELRKKHQALSAKIEDEQSHPGASDLTIQALKREKLRLKDEIERLTSKVH